MGVVLTNIALLTGAWVLLWVGVGLVPHRVEPGPADPRRVRPGGYAPHVGLTTERADHPAFSEDQAAAEIRRLVSDAVLKHNATDAVLTADHARDRRPALHLTEDL